MFSSTEAAFHTYELLVSFLNTCYVAGTVLKAR